MSSTFCLLFFFLKYAHFLELKLLLCVTVFNSLKNVLKLFKFKKNRIMWPRLNYFLKFAFPPLPPLQIRKKIK